MDQKQIMFLIANILAGVGTFLFTISSVFRSKKKILATQCVYHFGFAVAADIMLGGYVGLFQEVMSGVRNLFVIFNKNTRIVNIAVMIVAVLLSAFGMYVEAYGLDLGFFKINPLYENCNGYGDYLARGGWMSFLPIIANLQYSIVVLKVKNPILLRSSLLFSAVCWSTYLFYIGSVASAILNLMSLGINTYQLISYILVLRKKGVRIIDDIKGTGEINVSVIKEAEAEPEEVATTPDVEANPSN